MIMSDNTKHLDILISGFVTGGGAFRVFNYISKSLAPLPPNASWLQTTLYNLISGTSGHDPKNNVIGTDNKTIGGGK